MLVVYSLKIEDVLAEDHGLKICIHYRAQNGFGGTNVETMAFTPDRNSSSPGFVAKTCRHLKDYTAESLMVMQHSV